MDKAAVEAALRAAELTDTELDQYKQRAAAALAKMQGKSGGAAQSDAETVSAHSAIASFAGVSNWASGGVAKFCIDRYLKYAHLADAPELEVLGDTFDAATRRAPRVAVFAWRTHRPDSEASAKPRWVRRRSTRPPGRRRRPARRRRC